ncbi:MAG TPA: phenylacetate--CoA ligase family protein [Actinomycetota bacterium]
MERKSGLASEREALDDEARAAHHVDLLRKTVEVCWETGGLYREKLEQAGVKPGDVNDLGALARIPVTTKSEAQAARAGLGTFPLVEAKRIFVSPGPNFYASHRRADPPPKRGETPLAFAFHAMGFRENDIVLNTFSYHLSPGGFGLEEQLNTAGCAVVPAGPQNTEVQAEILAKLPVTGYVGTPTFLRILCDKATERGEDPRGDWSLEVAFVTAEKLTEDARADLEARTGAMVRQVYGSADGLLPAYECWANAGMHLHPDQIFEVLGDDGAPADRGQVVATLPNANRPLLRFANGDVVELRDDPCPCGRTGARIASFVGRTDSATKVRGMFVYPEQVGQVMARFTGAPWQVVVARAPDGSDDLAVRVEATVDAGAIAGALKDAIRLRTRVEPVAPGTIPSGAPPLVDER